ncbi:hypothetical protein SAMN05444695_107164 [Rhodococcus triatomae]|uniref:PH domain-containing protein n=1 Tax=Rhodococcus triatomae TaxID=300028 RepID=A0A1G8KKZ1_9NOCA|nr:hypothetical protein [Rhodococcus triatomae]SDI43560.1 hypothetical protein SAMN05444695_107164 [Rhodococcus triatomae]
MSLDLIPAELIRQRLRIVTTLTLVLAVGFGVLVALFTTPLVGLVFGLVIAGPAILLVIRTWRHRITLSGNVLRSTGLFGATEVDVASAREIEMVVRSARLSQVALRVQGDGGSVLVPLAFYTGAGARELEILPLRKLADALSAGETAFGAAVASVLIGQLRAEARGAGLAERPLYRAATTAAGSGARSQRALTDAEVASLVE